mgnify:CR=1 FL=1
MSALNKLAKCSPVEPQIVPSSRAEGRIDLLQAVQLPAALLNDALTVAGQFPQLPLRPVRDEAGPQKAVLEQVRDPLRVLYIGLPPRHRLHMCGVNDNRIQVQQLEQVIQGLPIGPCTFHGSHLARAPGACWNGWPQESHWMTAGRLPSCSTTAFCPNWMTLMIARTDPGPGAQVSTGGETAHVCTNFSQNDLRTALSNAGIDPLP